MAMFTDILIRNGVISKEQLTHADQVSRDQATSVGEALVSLGYATAEQVMRTIAEEHNLEFIDLNETSISPTVVELVPESVARENTILPLDEASDDALRVIVSDPLDLETFDKTAFHPQLSNRNRFGDSREHPGSDQPVLWPDRG